MILGGTTGTLGRRGSSHPLTRTETMKTNRSVNVEPTGEKEAENVVGGSHVCMPRCNHTSGCKCKCNHSLHCVCNGHTHT